MLGDLSRVLILCDISHPTISRDSARRFCRRVHIPCDILRPPPPSTALGDFVAEFTSSATSHIPPSPSIALGDFVAEFTSFTSVLLPLFSLKYRQKSSFFIKMNSNHLLFMQSDANISVIRCYYTFNLMRIYVQPYANKRTGRSI